MISNLNRRALLQAMLAGSLLATVPRVAFANTAGERRFVFVILRGGMDGLSAVPAFGDPDFATLRGPLAIAAPGKADGALALDDRFGLHPSLAPIHEMWAAGQMQVVHAASTPYRERSHFDAQNVLETGGAKPSGSGVGWLNRALGLMGSSGLGLAVSPSAPLMMSGPTQVATWVQGNDQPPSAYLLDAIDRLYGDDEAFHAALASARDTEDLLADAQTSSMMRERGLSRLAPAFKGLASLMRDQRGPRVATIEVTGWDTHSAQGNAKGRLATLLGQFGDGLATLKKDLGPVWAKTIVVAATEFGRTAAPNGTGGTDHGTAGAAFVLGGALNGARVLADWPGLSRDKLYEGRDLAPTSDLRGVFAAVLRDHLGLPEQDIRARVFVDAGSLQFQPDVVKV
ncbi:DUF1501 domain-containing protein [Oleomonas cavernae]|uniref:DUF1501 domain-containing protein n=1 Tax=Oleomonas cavernae TaxID=2320859 RepID=A0A418WTK5_9PROT|nr:DUF1501 domain-containing protein [Oleomonas cavernae]RJF94506.1 DUF1501 domain-containing protein [Oleomonas cavernae]